MNWTLIITTLIGIIPGVIASYLAYKAQAQSKANAATLQKVVTTQERQGQ